MADEVQPVRSGHVSYSSLADWLKCGKYWQLKRSLRLPEQPALWNVGGHAVHAAIEEYEKSLVSGGGENAGL